jgi:hypothetical protein
MKRRALLCGLLTLTLAIPLWAYVQVGVEDSYARQFTGVKLPATEGVSTFRQNEPLAGEVIDAAKLMSHGLKAVKKGDAIEVKWLGGEKFKFMHIPSGKSVEIVFPKDKLKKK